VKEAPEGYERPAPPAGNVRERRPAGEPSALRTAGLIRPQKPEFQVRYVFGLAVLALLWRYSLERACAKKWTRYDRTRSGRFPTEGWNLFGLRGEAAVENVTGSQLVHYSKAGAKGDGALHDQVLGASHVPAALRGARVAIKTVSWRDGPVPFEVDGADALRADVVVGVSTWDDQAVHVLGFLERAEFTAACRPHPTKPHLVACPQDALRPIRPLLAADPDAPAWGKFPAWPARLHWGVDAFAPTDLAPGEKLAFNVREEVDRLLADRRLWSLLQEGRHDGKGDGDARGQEGRLGF